jgi:hypothetical protein
MFATCEAHQAPVFTEGRPLSSVGISFFRIDLLGLHPRIYLRDTFVATAASTVPSLVWIKENSLPLGAIKMSN